MTRISFRQWLGVLAVGAALLLSVAVSPASAEGKAVVRPFKGSWAGQLVEASDIVCPPGTFPGRTIASGQATHLGHFDLEVTACGDGVFSTGLAAYTAANGDELNIAFEAMWTQNGDGSTTIVASATDVTGTGRFLNADVSGTDTISVALGSNRPIGILDGTITYNASDRSTR